MVNYIKRLMLFRLTMLIIWSKKLTMTQKIGETGKKIADHVHSNKYINAKEFNNLTAEKH